MAQGEIDDPHVKALFAEVTAVKMIIRAMLEGMLPRDQSEAWKEIEAMVEMIGKIARGGKVAGTEPETSKQILKVAETIATDFVRSVGRKAKTQ
jgi:hypothetical protein